MIKAFKRREDSQSNYSAVFINGKTLRIPLDASKPITELRFPEFWDVSPGTKCSGGCRYCYASADRSGVHYTNLAQKVRDFFGAMDDNSKPFQVAVGGSTEPLENPEIWEMMQEFKTLGITPNYTSNGMFLSEKNIEKTLEVCGGVALTAHRHLEKFWRRALARLAKSGVRVNIHVIIHDTESVEFTRKLYDEFVTHGEVEYFVLLPYISSGFAARDPKSIDYVAFKKWVDSVHQDGRLAFGANFYNFLKKHQQLYNVALYQPEIMSAYIKLSDTIAVSNNSFDETPVGWDSINGRELGKVRTEFLKV